MDLKAISLSSIFYTFLEKGLRLKKAKNSILDKINFVLSGNFGKLDKLPFSHLQRIQVQKLLRQDYSLSL